MAKVAIFELHIISPTKKEIIQVEWIDVKTPTGNFIIGPNHSPLVSIIRERSILQYKEVNSLRPLKMDIYGGFLKIENGNAIVNVDL